MIPKECKRLAEVDFPIAVVSKHAAKEKSIRYGHPSTLHLWWARRPLAACRAMLLALLLPDPCDEDCPEDFKQKAREYLVSPIASGTVGPSDLELREALLKFIGDFANWDLASNRTYLEASRKLVKAAHGEVPPLVVDPFAGGGSIPLEALRLGCEAFASDLNPVACLILKVMLEDIPRHGAGLADQLRRVGEEIKKTAERELAEFYPDDADGAKPIAYLWARTVRCETPNCGAEIPLMRSFWLCKKASRRRALKYKTAVRRVPSFSDGKAAKLVPDSPQVELEIFEPKSEREVPTGTVSRAKATCLCCQTVLSPDRVRAQLREQSGGADVIFDEKGNRSGGARMLAVVTLKTSEQGRHYRLPTSRDYNAVRKASKRIDEIAGVKLPNDLLAIPDEPTPAGGGSGASRAFSIQNYGMMKFGDLFTARQKVSLVATATAVQASSAEPSVQELAGLCVSRAAARNSSLCLWLSHGDQETVWTTFGRNALPIVWDFAEAVPLSQSTGSLSDSFRVAIDAILGYPVEMRESALVQTCDAAAPYPLPDEATSVWFTDPPYYDAIPYADLSDFFFVWLKRVLPGHPLLRDPFDSSNQLTPKAREVVLDETKKYGDQVKGRGFFEERMARAFSEGRRHTRSDGIGAVVFAHKTTEGWEALIAGIIQSGWTVTASWPITTERTSRPRAHGSAALSSSVHLVCRPRNENKTGDWGAVLRELPKRVGDWMERLQSEGIRGADLVFACIGPALEIYSQYAKVVDAEEREIPLGGDPEAKEPHKRGYLAYVWEVVGRTALEQILGTAEAKARNGAAGALEEDARLTALFLWTLQSTNGKEIDADKGSEDVEEAAVDNDDEDEGSKSKPKGFTLIYDVARRFAQPLGIHLEDWEGRTIEIKKGVVRLLPISERAKQLFGEEGMQTVAAELERGSRESLQMGLFPDVKDRDAPKVRGRRTRASSETSDREMQTRWEPTTLDRVHAAMLLQSSGRANALRALLETEQEHGPDFLRLANALSALYPKDSEEKRLLDAMLLAVPR